MHGINLTHRIPHRSRSLRQPKSGRDVLLVCYPCFNACTAKVWLHSAKLLAARTSRGEQPPF